MLIIANEELPLMKIKLTRPTETIYQCLGSAFWTQRKCWNCQQPFTQANYQANNYYLTFQEILKVYVSKEFPEPRDNACLEGVIVKLFHKYCPTPI